MRYRCTEHDVTVSVDVAHRSGNVKVPPGAGQCLLPLHWHEGIKDPQAIVGEMGVWDPRKGKAFCNFVLEPDGEVVS